MFLRSMDASTDIRVRSIADSEIAAFHRAVNRGFGGEPRPKEDEALLPKILDIPRTLSSRAYSQMGRCVLGIRDGSDSIARLDRMFASDPLPWCPEIF